MSGLDRSEIEDVVRDVLSRYAVLQVAGQGAVQIFSPGSGTPRAANWGASAAHWPASAIESDNTQVLHGLPGIPGTLLAAIGTPGADIGVKAYPRFSNITSTSFIVNFTSSAALSAQSVPFFWAALL